MTSEKLYSFYKGKHGGALYKDSNFLILVDNMLTQTFIFKNEEAIGNFNFLLDTDPVML